MSRDEPPIASRPTSTAFSAKNTEQVKSAIPEEMFLDLQRFVAVNGYTSMSDCIRELIAIALYGVDEVADHHRRRIARLGQYATKTGTEKAR